MFLLLYELLSLLSLLFQKLLFLMFLLLLLLFLLLDQLLLKFRLVKLRWWTRHRALEQDNYSLRGSLNLTEAAMLEKEAFCRAKPLTV